MTLDNKAQSIEKYLLASKLEKHVDTDFAVTEDSNDETSNSSQGSPSAFPKIVACGKGTALYMPAIFAKVIELSAKEKPNVLYIGTASFDADLNFKRHSKAFNEIGCVVKRLNVSAKKTTPIIEEIRKLVNEFADIIVCSGGNTLHALLRWKETGLDLMIKEAALEKGVVLCGGSAGAGCWFDTIHSDSLRPDNVKHKDKVRAALDEEELSDWDYVQISAHGYVPGMCIPHFDSAVKGNELSRSEHAAIMVTENPDTTAIGLDNNAALVVEGDKAQIVSGDGEATCHVVVADEKTGETISVPLPRTEEPLSFDDLLDVVHPSEAEHLKDLEEHVDTDFTIASDLALPTPSLSRVPSAESLSSAKSATCGIVETPKIVAAGRMKALQLAPVFEKVIELSGKEKPNILYIGTASFDRSDKFIVCTKAFRELGCTVLRLDVSEEETVPSAEEMERLIVNWADALVCSGGNTLHALLRWKDTGVDVLMKKAAEKGVVLCGASAGAGCWFSSIHSDSLRPDNVKHKERVLSDLDDEDLAEWDYVKISCMGYIDAMCVPHFDTTGTNDVARSEHAKELLAENPDIPAAIGIDENAAFVVHGDRAQVLSGDGEAGCHVVLNEEGTSVSTPLVLTDEPVHIDELMGESLK